MKNLSAEALWCFLSFIAAFIFCLFYWLIFSPNAIFSTAIIFLILSSISTGISTISLQKLEPWRSSGIANEPNLWSVFSVAWRAGLLGCVFAFGLFLITNDRYPNLQPFGYYLCILSFFHWSEYFVTAISSRETLNLDSFLLNHSVEYWAAASASWLEFAVEYYFFPCKLNFLYCCR